MRYQAPVGVTYWRCHDDDPRCLGLFRDGVQIGYYELHTNVYRTYDAATDTWGEPVDPPWGRPELPEFRKSKPKPEPGTAREQNEEKIAPNLLDEPGVDRSKFPPPGKEEWRWNGKIISIDRAMHLFQARKLPEDSRLLRLTVIGSEAECALVRKDLESAPLSDLAGLMVVQFYRPDDWALRPGFVTTGHPTIYLERPDGYVIGRDDEYAGAAQLYEALRRARADYDPAKDRSLTRPASTVTIPLAPLSALAVLLLLALYLWRSHGPNHAN